MEGESLSGAAYAAGFADSAHLSRTSRTMFGLAAIGDADEGPAQRLRGHAETSLGLNDRTRQGT